MHWFSAPATPLPMTTARVITRPKISNEAEIPTGRLIGLMWRSYCVRKLCCASEDIIRIRRLSFFPENEMQRKMVLGFKCILKAELIWPKLWRSPSEAQSIFWTPKKNRTEGKRKENLFSFFLAKQTDPNSSSSLRGKCGRVQKERYRRWLWRLPWVLSPLR